MTSSFLNSKVKSQPSFHLSVISLPASLIRFLHFISRTTHALGFFPCLTDHLCSPSPLLIIYTHSYGDLAQFNGFDTILKWIFQLRSHLDLQTSIPNCLLHNTSLDICSHLKPNTSKAVLSIPFPVFPESDDGNFIVQVSHLRVLPLSVKLFYLFTWLALPPALTSLFKIVVFFHTSDSSYIVFIFVTFIAF